MGADGSQRYMRRLAETILIIIGNERIFSAAPYQQQFGVQLTEVEMLLLFFQLTLPAVLPSKDELQLLSQHRFPHEAGCG